MARQPANRRGPSTCLQLVKYGFLFVIALLVLGVIMTQGERNGSKDLVRADLGEGPVPAPLGETRAAGHQSSAPSPKPEPAEEPAPPPVLHAIGDRVEVGYMAYKINRAWWSNTLRLFGQVRAGAFLLVDLTVGNQDDEPSMVPPLKLVDEGGAEFSAASTLANNAYPVLQELNPGISRQGVAVFEVRAGGTYRLVLSGGLMSGKQELVDLSKAEPVKK